MPAPVAVYVVAAIAGVAAVVAFKEFVFEPHIAPAMERWAEGFLANRATRRAQRRNPIPIPVHSTGGPGNGDDQGSTSGKRTLAVDDAIQLEPIDEWRIDVHRSAPGTGVRRRNRVVPDTDEGSISTTIDDSFTTLSHTPIAPTHVISNISSPFTDTFSISTPTPIRSRTHSGSSSRTTSDHGHQGGTIVLFAPTSPASSAPPSPPFGPILPDTPRTSAAYSSRPFSPVIRMPGRSRAPSSRSSLQHSGLDARISVNIQGSSHVAVNFEGEHMSVDDDNYASVYESVSRAGDANASVVGSLSERYPAPPSPPVLLSPPSPHTVLSSPNTDILSLGSSGSRSGSPFDVVSPPTHFGVLHLSPPVLHTSPSATTSEDEFISFGEVSDGDRDVVSALQNTRTLNPFSDLDEGSESESEVSESGSEGSWGRVSHATGRR